MADRSQYKHDWYLENADRVKQHKLDKLRELRENPDDPQHGVTGYHLGCRCSKCRYAGAESRRRYSARKLEEMRKNPNHKSHGTLTGYCCGCRCDRCREAYRKYRMEKFGIGMKKSDTTDEDGNPDSEMVTEND